MKAIILAAGYALSQFAVATIDENNKMIELEEKPQIPKAIQLYMRATYVRKKQ